MLSIRCVYCFLILCVTFFYSCEKKCSLNVDDCEKIIIGSALMHDCVCDCWHGDKILYTSPHDGKQICSNWNTNGTWADECYMYDHISYNGDSVVERVVADVCLSYGIVRPSATDVYPDQGSIELAFRYHHNKKDCTYLSSKTGWGGFYLKNGMRDTLFMDKLVGFFYNEYWICDSDRYFMSGYAVRNEESLDWHIGLYGINTVDDPIDLVFDVHNGVAIPDTVLHISMPKIGSKF
jgi:hypothetical protein